jgi:hypothetical protein
MGGLEKVCPMVSALVLGGAVIFTLMAAYQWAGRIAIVLWLVWFSG